MGDACRRDAPARGRSDGDIKKEEETMMMQKKSKRKLLSLLLSRVLFKILN